MLNEDSIERIATMTQLSPAQVRAVMQAIEVEKEAIENRQRRSEEFEARFGPDL